MDAFHLLADRVIDHLIGGFHQFCKQFVVHFIPRLMLVNSIERVSTQGEPNPLAMAPDSDHEECRVFHTLGGLLFVMSTHFASLHV